MAEFVLKSFDEKIHNIYLKGYVDEDMLGTLVDKINEIKSADEDIEAQNVASLLAIGIDVQVIRPAVNIYLSTYGGNVYDMFSIYDEIRALKKEYEVNMYCVGKVMSAGSIIMLAADLDHRFAYANTTFMIHTVSSLTNGKIKTMEEDVDEVKRLHKMMWNIYKTNTEIPEEKLDEIYKCKKDWFLTAEQAKKYKIIGSVL